MKHTKPLAACILATASLVLVAGCASAPTDAKPEISVLGTSAVEPSTFSSPAADKRAPASAASSTSPRTTPTAEQASGAVRRGNTIDVTEVGDVAFATPSGNIFCILSANSAESPSATIRCDIRTSTFTPPRQPASCLFDWGQSLYVDTKAGFGCISDAIAYEALVTSSMVTSWWDRSVDGTATTYAGVSAALAYGKTMISGDLRCTSTRAGLTCKNTRTHAKFFLSRDSYTLSN